MKSYWKVFIGFIVAALLYKYLGVWLPQLGSTFYTLLWCVILIGLGLLMAPTRKKNNRWLGKTILAVLMMIVIIYKIQLVDVSGFTNILNMIGLSNGFLDILLVVCGWAFFQV